MAEYPTEQERKALCEILLTHVASKGIVEKALIEYLFACSIAAGAEEKHISETHVLLECKGGPSTETAVRAAMSRLRANCEYFFAYHHVGRQQTYKVVFEKKEYLPQYEFNHPPPIAGDLVKSFWGPYYMSDRVIRIFYPELFHDTAGLSFTPTAIVQAMTILFETLQKSPKTKFTATALKPTEPIPNQDEDIVVIGTPATMPQLLQMEIGCPLKSEPHNVSSSSAATIPVQDEQSNDKLTINHRLEATALISRTWRLFRGRVATTISATSYAAFPALASFLTQQNDLKILTQLLALEVFPERFQVPFRLSMLNIAGREVIHQITPVSVIRLDT